MQHMRPVSSTRLVEVVKPCDLQSAWNVASAKELGLTVDCCISHSREVQQGRQAARRHMAAKYRAATDWDSPAAQTDGQARSLACFPPRVNSTTALLMPCFSIFEAR